MFRLKVCYKAGSGMGGGNIRGATSQQRAMMAKLSGRFSTGGQGIEKFGGYGSRITDGITYRRNANGDIEYRVVGERTLPAQPSATIGVRGLPERRRTTVSSGRINKDGSRVAYANKNTEVATERALTRKR